jgi:hypothetical protein
VALMIAQDLGMRPLQAQCLNGLSRLQKDGRKLSIDRAACSRRQLALPGSGHKKNPTAW